MRFTNEHRPLFAWDRSVLVASGGRARLVPTVHEGAGVAWVVQDLQHAAEQQRTPDQLALAWPGLDVAREQQLVRLELADRRRGRARAAERGEQQPHRVLDLLIRIQHDAIERIVGQANRQRQLQLASTRLVQHAPDQACTQHVQLGLAHRALETQQEPIVDWLGSYSPSSSRISVPLSAHNSSKRCQSVELRASRETSSPRTMPT